MPSENNNLYAHFQQQFTQHATKPVLSTAGITLTYQHLEDESARIAACLDNLGLVVGDRVSVQVNKSPQALCLYLACLRAGYVFHPLNTGYKAHELSYFLSNAEPRLLVCDQANVDMMTDLARKADVKHVLTLNADGSGSLTERAATMPAEFGVVVREANDLAALLYSSGTTGVPKGIMLSHGNLLSNGQSLVKGWGFTENDVLLHALPIFHVHGLFVALSCVLLSGASMKWMAAFDLDAALSILPDCTVMMGVPTYYTRLLSASQFDQKLVASMRLFISGSAPLLEETFFEFEERTGHCILERYGMTETNMNTSNPLEGERKAGTVGLPLPGVSVRIVDANGATLGANETGDLQVKGRNVFQGYWKMPEKTAEDFTADGFFNTGDKGRIDDDGYVAIVGRAKDMVITGGLNVYPKEVELIIDDLAGVKESAVIGLPHPDFGEAVAAVIVPSGTQALNPQFIITSLKETVSGFKVPKQVFVVDELPRNTMGKVQKNILREQFANTFK